MKIIGYLKLKQKFNTLKNDYELLIERTKEELLEDYMRHRAILEELESAREEIKKLRLKIKETKEIKNDYGKHHKQERSKR